MSEQRDEELYAAIFPAIQSHFDHSSVLSDLEDAAWDVVNTLEGYRTPRIIDADNAAEELGALPIRSVVLAHWEDGHQPDYTMMRCAEGGASSSGYGLADTRHWIGMANWGAILTVLYEPTP